MKICRKIVYNKANGQANISLPRKAIESIINETNKLPKKIFIEISSRRD
jgi:hypothetical protein